MKRAVSALVLSALSSTAVAWEADALRSGMTLAEATKTILSQGESVERKVDISGLRNAYFLQLRNGWLGFCLDLLYSYDRFLPGGFEAFVVNAEKEERRRGAPTLRSIAEKFEIIATWHAGEDRFALAVSKEGPNRFVFSRVYEDLAVKKPCL